MKKHAKRVLVLSLGILFLLVGLAGLVLPIIQGWFFLAISLLLFSMYSPSLRAWIDRHTQRYPHLHTFVMRAEAFVVRVFGLPEE